MVVLDILIFSIFTIFIILGIWKGIIGSVFKVAGIVSGLVLAFILYETTTNSLADYFPLFAAKDTLAYIIAFIGILALTVILFLLGAKLITSILKTLKLKWLDNLIGGLFGFTLALILNSGIIFGANALYENDFYPQFKNSISKKFILPVITDLKTVLTNESSSEFKDYVDLEKMKKELTNKVEGMSVKDLIPDSLKVKDLQIDNASQADTLQAK